MLVFNNDISNMWNESGYDMEEYQTKTATRECLVLAESWQRHGDVKDRYYQIKTIFWKMPFFQRDLE